MANNRIQHKRSTVSGVVPTTSDVLAGELGINLVDRKLYTSNGSTVFELGSNLTSLSVGNTTVTQSINSTGAHVNGTISLTKNDTRLAFTPVAGGSNVYFTQQNDDNFVFYTTNTTGGVRSVFNVYANTNAPNQNSALRFNGPIDIGSQGLYANNSLGTVGQVLTTNGSSTFWADVTTPPAGSNTQVQFNDSGAAGASAGFTFDKASNNLAVSNTISTSNLVVSGGISANGSYGISGYVMTSNGTAAYWSAPGGSKPLAMTLIFGR